MKNGVDKRIAGNAVGKDVSKAVRHVRRRPRRAGDGCLVRVDHRGFVPRVNADVPGVLSVVIDCEMQWLIPVADVMTDVRSGQDCLRPVTPLQLANERVVRPDRRPRKNADILYCRPAVNGDERIKVRRKCVERRIPFEVDKMLRGLRRVGSLPVVRVGGVLPEERAVLDEKQHAGGEVVGGLCVDDPVPRRPPAKCKEGGAQKEWDSHPAERAGILDHQFAFSLFSVKISQKPPPGRGSMNCQNPVYGKRGYRSISDSFSRMLMMNGSAPSILYYPSLPMTM